MRGTILRIADLRSQPAYIRVAVCRSTPSRRMVECSAVRHHELRGGRSSRLPSSRFASLNLVDGAPPPARDQPARPTLGSSRPKNRRIYLLDRPFHIRTPGTEPAASVPTSRFLAEPRAMIPGSMSR